jgi:uncharacterized C2H2 Zn-finger protein
VILKTYYDTGHTDTFDSDHLTDASMLRGNLLTNWSLDIGDARGGAGCLLLSLYWYPATGIGETPVGPKGLPIARRRDGWSFVVADSDDLPHLIMAEVDGEVVVLRAGDDLVDCNRLAHVSRISESFAKQVVSAHSWLLLASPGSTESDICRMLGMSADAYEAIAEAAGELARERQPDRF